MDARPLELGEQVVDLLILRHEVGLAHEFTPVEIGLLVNVRNQILHVEDAHNLVKRLFVDGNPAIPGL